MRYFKLFLMSGFILCLFACAALYVFLASQLPQLDGVKSSEHISASGAIERDLLGQAVIKAQNQADAAFLLGFAHAQDRLFQLDLLRKSAAGELSEVVGKLALERDKTNRFFQFRQRAQTIVDSLNPQQRELLEQYANGVNSFIDEYGSTGFEFTLTGTQMQPWKPQDTILATFSMYIDLQSSQVERDFENTAIRDLFGQQMLDFMYQPSNYQAAIDQSIERAPNAIIPIIKRAPSDATKIAQGATHDYETQDIGSNNWAVASALTNSKSAMLSSDMHLGLNVPIIWYRTQLNFTHNGQDISATGVSLPGTPLIIAGSNQHVAWGFTNSNVDNVDWIRLDDSAQLETHSELISIKDETPIEYQFEISEFGPVQELNGEKYALSWVALMPYAVNMDIANMPLQTSSADALSLAKTVAIPVQNMVVADRNGNIGWQLTGAITARTTPSLAAIEQSEFDPNWHIQDTSPAFVYNPELQRVWSANARVVSTKDLSRYGDGGYALGARQHQILESLLANEQFDEQAFNQMQLDNRALFLARWHALLLSTLQQQTENFATDIDLLEKWQACACADSIAYTLVRKFRDTVIERLFQPVEDGLQTLDIDMRRSTRLIEVSVWQILEETPLAWLPSDYENYSDFLISTYAQTKDMLISKHDADPSTLDGLQWGAVNALTITHPFANSLGPLASFLNMPVVESFGDSFMPAVQGRNFGASQRLIVRPGDLDKAILTVPGGQSMHPLSEYFDAGFKEYADGANTPLLPQTIEHILRFTPTQ